MDAVQSMEFAQVCRAHGTSSALEASKRDGRAYRGTWVDTVTRHRARSGRRVPIMQLAAFPKGDGREHLMSDSIS